MTNAGLPLAAAYNLLPVELSPGTAAAALLDLWILAAVATAVNVAQWAVHTRRRNAAWPKQLRVLTQPAPTVSGLELAMGAVGVLAALLALLQIGRPGVWQATLITGYAVAMVNHRNFDSLVALAPMALATLGLIGLPLAVASEWLPPDGERSLTQREVWMLGGFATLFCSFLWGWLGRHWSHQQSEAGPITTGNKLTRHALAFGMLCLLVAAACLAQAFLLPTPRLG